MRTDIEPDLIVEPAETSERESDGARTLALHSFLISTVMVLMLNSGGILELSRKLPFGPLRDTGEALAITWHARMDAYGLTALQEEVARWVRNFRERHWQPHMDMRSPDHSPAHRFPERIEQREV